MGRLAESEKLLVEYERFLKIERDGLDDELVGQPERFFKVTEQLAFAVSFRDQAKKDGKRIRAEADKRVRHALKAAQEKGSEDFIKREIELDKEVRDCEDWGMEWSLLADRWQGLKESLQQRSYILGNLADMYVRAYNMSSSGGSARGEVLNRSAESVRRDQKEARKTAAKE